MANSQNNLVPTHLDRFPPTMFGNTTFDLMKKAEALGVKDEDCIKELNVKRYMRNLEVLQADGLKLAIMPVQTEEMILTALYQNIEAFRFVTEQTPAVCEMALSIKPDLIQFFKEQRDEHIEFVINKSFGYIKLVREPKPYQLEMCLDKDWESIKYFKKEWITQSIVKYAIDRFSAYFLDKNILPNPAAIKNSTPLAYANQTQELVDYAINKDFALIVDAKTCFVKKEVVEDAIKRMPIIISHIDEQVVTKELVFKAITFQLELCKPENSLEFYAADMVKLIRPEEWDENVAIDLMKMFRPFWEKYETVVRYLRVWNYKDVHCKPTFLNPSKKIIDAIFELGYVLTFEDINFDYEEGDERLKTVLRHNSSFKLGKKKNKKRIGWKIKAKFGLL